MIESFYVNHFKVSIITLNEKKIAFMDLSIPCNKEITNLEYINAQLYTRIGEIKRIILCPVNGRAFVCNAVIELNGEYEAEEVYRETESVLRRVGCTP